MGEKDHFLAFLASVQINTRIVSAKLNLCLPVSKHPPKDPPKTINWKEIKVSLLKYCVDVYNCFESLYLNSNIDLTIDSSHGNLQTAVEEVALN